ncbi:MAG: MBOAT family protein, partial [Clostridiaceae bacterium]|nr:MBOAT family protein [Clostridiaceae bacterium]
MTFVSAAFVVFLLALFVLYYTLPRSWQWPLLLVAGYIFYAFAGPTFLIYVVATTITAWYGTLRIHRLQLEQKDYLAQNKSTLDREGRKQYKSKMKKRQQIWFWSALLFNIGLLAIVKYTDFVIFNINSLMSVFNSGGKLDFLDIALPLGMSFYTFQTVGYVIDVYRAKHPPEKNLFKLGLFVSFFPQMIQGPISRFSDLAPDLYSQHQFDSDKFSQGIQRILWGFFKKVVIADRVIAAVSTIFQEPDQYRGIYVFVGMIFYALQLYADFTGGIDITIGIAQALGIGLKENFERPFFAKSTAEYWRRWHITMGTWFRDYIFYPLSVSKPMLKLSNNSRKLLGSGFGRRFPVYVSTIIVWFTTGLWHGASWNFVVWGLLNGLVIIISQELEPFYDVFHRKFSVAGKTWFRMFQVARTFFLMSSIRLLDCYRDVGLTFRQYLSMFTEFDLSVISNGSMLELGLSLADYVLLAVGTIMLTSVS